ncbi:hypothetical protein [Roseovarius sp. D22-M7]|uniref:hypothetical protein n=1 Tax=Roseovarius sp. D22-M7 TaxID=3127116 RepID=UPI00300FBB98
MRSPASCRDFVGLNAIARAAGRLTGDYVLMAWHCAVLQALFRHFVSDEIRVTGGIRTRTGNAADGIGPLDLL